MDTDNPSPSLAALVAECWPLISPNTNFGSEFPIHTVHGACLYKALDGSWMVEVQNRSGTIWCPLADIELPENEALYWALVGALVAWLIQNASCPLIGSYPTPDGREGCRVHYYAGKHHAADDPDPLRALCLAAIAVARAKKEGTKK